MTNTEIINMAREAGIPIEIDWAGRPSTLVVKDSGTYLRGIDDLERFAALVRNAALEEAAVVCEAVGQEANIAWRSAYRTLDQGIERGADDCADTIRNLKETK